MLRAGMLAFDEIPLVDDHVHPPLLDAGGRPLASFFTEASDAESIAVHVPRTLFYEHALRELAGLLGCEANEEAVRAARAAIAPDTYLRRLVQDANIETLLVDEGYPPEGKLSTERLAAAAGCQGRRILRLETLAEALLPAAASARALAEAMRAHLEAAPPFVALKTIIAYRSGLAVEEPEPTLLAERFARAQAASGDRPPRLTEKPLLDYLLLRALDWAAEREVPVQFHTGYGDRDLDLRVASPAHLRPLLDEPRYAGLNVVLLHAAYPYTREASYLALVYPRVYVDWSEVNPMLPRRQLQRVIEELLALAPYSKLLYGSDAWGVPDWLWLGARKGRAALAAALEGLPNSDAIARRILNENARELYRLDPT